MAFLLNNIGYIILGVLALVVMGSGGGNDDVKSKSEYADFDESAWANSPENPNSPNYTGI